MRQKFFCILDEKTMIIRSIQENDWQAILTIQQKAYTQIEPESESVLRNKFVLSPSSCMVAVDNEQVIGCCLAYPWQAGTVPPLHEEIVNSPDSDNLFIHDMAVFPTCRGKGVASFLCRSLLEVANKSGFATMSLVAVQNAMPFWNKFGFCSNRQIPLQKDYGTGAMFMELNLRKN